nr:hypothetical transcript [Hymenolepis microstoma]
MFILSPPFHSLQAEEDTMRCPICRETIIVPRGGGGAATFPPAFIVNQLLDLMASQRRDRVPKCRRHPGQELLFCETCDVIFCPDCRGGNTRSAVYPLAYHVCPF